MRCETLELFCQVHKLDPVVAKPVLAALGARTPENELVHPGSEQQKILDSCQDAPPAKKPGRPKGSRNKPAEAAEGAEKS